MVRFFLAASAVLATGALFGQATASTTSMIGEICEMGEIYCCAPTDSTATTFGVMQMIGCVGPSDCPSTEHYGIIGGELMEDITTANSSLITGSSSYCKCGPRATREAEWGYNCKIDKCVKQGCGTDLSSKCHTGNVNDCLAYELGEAIGNVGLMVTMMLYLPYIILCVILLIIILIAYCCCCKSRKQTIVVQQAK
jgi:hypothetical protein